MPHNEPKADQGMFRVSQRRMKVRPKGVSKNFFRGKLKPARTAAK